MATATSRAQGLLLGLAAADRNGGPMRLAVRIAEAALGLANPTNVESLRQAIAQRYMSWYDPKLKLFPETEAAYDTGRVFDVVFRQMSARIGQLRPEDAQAVMSATADVTLSTMIDECVTKCDASRESAGVGAAHRAAVLAAIRGISTEEDLVLAVKGETTLTHVNEEAIDTAVAVALTCRHLIVASQEPSTLLPSMQLATALKRALPHVRDDSVRRVIARWTSWTLAPPSERTPTYRDGKAALVLDAALYFLFNSSTFDTALTDSLTFAGPENYCPVLVGSIGGALWGVSPVDGGGVDIDVHLAHREARRSAFANRAVATARRLGDLWA